MGKALGVTLVVLALAIIAVPQFTNCEAQGRLLTLANGATTPMKCTWTARAEIGVGAPIFAIGAVMLFTRKKESLAYLGVPGIVLGVFAALLPTSLIGVCKSNMVCHTVMQPSLVTLGALAGAVSLVGVALSLRRKG